MPYIKRLLMGCVVALAELFAGTSVAAQDTTSGRIASSAVGEAGQRQVREHGILGIEPMARIDNRVQNRVQSRVRNRIDRYYDPQANAVSPFEIAGEQARTAGRPVRR